VTVNVSNSRLQNPALRTDVNGDGNVSPIDALLIINHLARSGLPAIPVTPSDQAPPFYDVDGNQSISAVDALQVINELARRAAFGEGEPTAAVEESATLADASLDFVDLIADPRDDEDDEERLRALDSVFGDLS
jgi:hypothetical protein